MKYLIINAVCGIGSTGKICGAIAEACEQEGHEAKIAFGRDSTVPDRYRRFAVRIGSDLDVRLHGIASRLLDNHGFSSAAATRRFLQWADRYDPDVLWLHNIHGYYIHIGLLFDWMKKRPNMQVKWTLHDCWSFTGHCSHFDYAGCDRWKTGCHDCPEKGQYPASLLLDNSAGNYARKKELFTGVANMTLITPSQWLADLVKQSFLGEYPVTVHYNTIDTNIFKPTPGDFRQKHGLEDKKIILGVANVWGPRKGFQDLLTLSELLDDRFRIVLVGLSPQQVQTLPDNILGITRTNNATELAQLYSAADVFVNTTYEDNYPTVNLEARACGCPIICYRTGGCPETLAETDHLVAKGDIDALKEKILEVLL